MHIIGLTLLLACCLTLAPADADPLVEYAWQRIVGLGAPETGSALAVDGPRRWAYLFGGLAPGSTPVSDLYRDDLTDSHLRWEPLLAEGGPSPRAYAHAFFDRPGNRLLVLGGDNLAGNRFSDVWAWDEGTQLWSDVTPSVPGPASVDRRIALTHDTRRNRLLYLGPTGSSNNFVRLWAMSLDGPPVWSEIPTTGAPNLGAGSAAAYDSVGDRVFAIGAAYQALYELDVATGAWSLALATSPFPTLLNKNISWDAVDNRLIVHSTISGYAQVNFAVVDLDAPVLAWGPERPDGTEPLGSLLPWVYDPVGRELLVASWPGLSRLVSEDASPGSTRFRWVSNEPTSRYEVTAPRAQAADVRNRWWYILDGRSLRRAHLDDLGRFEHVHPGGIGPTPRNDQGAVWDSLANRIYFCGGTDSTGATHGDVWALELTDPPQWSLLAASPVPIRSAVAIDPVGRFLYATTSVLALKQLWRLDLAAPTPSWTLLLTELPVTPSTLAYDALNHRLLGVTPNEGTVIDLEPVPPVATPRVERPPGSSVHGAGIAFDPLRSRMLIVNGAMQFSNTGITFNWETHAFGAGGGTGFTDPGAMGERLLPPYGMLTTYDPVRDRMIALNGEEFYFPGTHPDTRIVLGMWALQFDPSVPTRLDIIDAVADAGGDAIHVRFAGEGPSGEVRVDRASGSAGDDWVDVGAALESTPGLYEFTDTDIARGATYRYRGRWFVDGIEHTTAASAPVTVSGGAVASLQLRARNGILARTWPLEFDVEIAPGAGTATLELIDVAGRVVARRSVDASGMVALKPVGAGAGIYFARLRQGAGAVHLRVVRL